MDLYETVIRESHLDTFGHLNNAVYLVLFEEARWQFITRNGYGLEKMKELQQGPITLEINMRFKREVKLREKIRIETSLTGFEGKINRCKQKMFKADGKIAAEIDLTIGLFDLRTRRLIEATPEWKQAIGLPGLAYSVAS